MDPVRNPYAPGAGNPPPELAGRSDIIDQATIAVRRIAFGNPNKSIILVGLRGVGKTVLLNNINVVAEREKCQTLFVEAHDGKSLPDLLVPGLRSILFSLSTKEAAKETAKRGIRVLKSFLGGLKVSVGGLDIDLSVDSERGIADSGDIEHDLPELICVIGEAAQKAGSAVILFIDEIQYLSEKEFSSIIMAIHRTNQLKLPVLLIGAGLPQVLSLAGNSKSYSERLFRYPRIGALSDEDAIRAIRNPAEEEGVEFEDLAIEKILLVTQKYPYFIQQWAYEAWNISDSEHISGSVIDQATKLALKELDESFFKVRFDRCTPAERRYMRALAECGDGIHRSANVSDKLKLKITTVAPTRNNLIRKGMIYSPGHGDTAFTVPLFHEYMIRIIPDLDTYNGSTF